MAKRDMFAEAIAEAKLVKETAIENAKAALTESFAPHLQSMISAKLQEMEMEDEEEVEETLDITESDTEETIDEVDNEMDELDELLKEIEGEDELDEAKKDDETETEDDETETKDDETEDELNIEDMSEEDLKSFIEDVINDMIEAGELEPGEDQEEEAEEDDDDEIDLNNIEDDEEEAEEVDEVLEDDMITNDELDEAYNTIKILRQEINEIKLLNAKLLYSNKIFKAKQLTEGKKLQVLHAFDKVTTVKEAKNTYEILKENLENKKTIKESFKGSSASKTITPIRESKQPIVEVDNQYKRWQVLAGIKK